MPAASHPENRPGSRDRPPKEREKKDSTTERWRKWLTNKRPIAAIMIIFIIVIGIGNFTGALLQIRQFLVDTLSHKSSAKPKPDFAFVTVKVFIEQGSGERILNGVYETNQGQKAVTPIDCFAVLQIAAKDKPQILDSISLELQTPTGWMVLRKLPQGIVRPYWGPPDHAQKGTPTVPDVQSLLGRTIDPRMPVTGFGLYQYERADFVPPPSGRTLRVTMTDAYGETMNIENRVRKTGPADFSGGEWSLTFHPPKFLDLTKLESRPFFSQ